MPLKEFPVSLLTHAEVATFTNSFVPIITKAPQSADLLHALGGEMTDGEAKMRQNTYLKTPNQITSELAQRDIYRDKCYNDTLKCIDGLRFRKDEAIAKAAEYLYGLFVIHDTSLPRKSYEIESHLLNSLFADLKKQEAQEAIKVTGLEKDINELFDSEARFKATADLKISDAAANISVQISILTAPIRDRISETLVILGVHERLSPDVYKEIVNEVNELITEYTTKARARQTRKSNNSDDTKKKDSQSSDSKNGAQGENKN